MKIRNGFVSNSSSSSFILRGVKLKIEDLAKRVNEDKDQDDLWNILYSKFPYSTHRVQMESTAYYFNNDIDYNKEDVIFGVKFASPEDGVVTEIKGPDDVKIRKQIEEKIGKVGQLKTYIQYVSNDNF